MTNNSQNLLSADSRLTVGQQFVYVWGQSVGQQSTDSRPSVGQLLADSQPTIDQQSVNCWPTVGQLSADCQLTVGRQSADSKFWELFFSKWFMIEMTWADSFMLIPFKTSIGSKSSNQVVCSFFVCLHPIGPKHFYCSFNSLSTADLYFN